MEWVDSAEWMDSVEWVGIHMVFHPNHLLSLVISGSKNVGAEAPVPLENESRKPLNIITVALY